MSAHDQLVVVLSITMAAAFLGFITAFFTARMRMSGRISLALLCLPLLSILLVGVEFGGDMRGLFAAVLFAFSVPVCLFYSFHARRRAPEKRMALAGFAGSILFSIGYLIMMPQIMYLLVRLFMGKEI